MMIKKLTQSDLNRSIEVTLSQYYDKKLFMVVNPATEWLFYFVDREGNTLCSTTSLAMALDIYNNA